jgi:peptidoglycan/xylan/chitin deacetylase (PgdA/CDA1 family)
MAADAYFIDGQPLVSLSRWPGGRTHAVAFSFDDGRVEDRRLLHLLNRHGLKGTFHLNGGRLGAADDLIGPEEVATLYAGHEVASHALTHPFLTELSDDRLRWEVEEDRRLLEGFSGSLVRGFAYPFGVYSKAIRGSLSSYGIEYARTVEDTGAFRLPDDWMAWHPTAHESKVDNALLDAFFYTGPEWHRRLRLMLLWGHSYEFSREGGWAHFEQLCETLNHRGGASLWCGTCLEVRRYARALREIVFTVDGSRVLNPSAWTVWIDVGGTPVEIPPGATVSLSSKKG